MKKNICRPITFYNNFVPPINEVQKWRYCAFGTLDGIDVGENIAEKDEQILSSVWKHQQKFYKKLNGKYMAQVIYAIKYDEWGIDQKFWSKKTDSKYPFAFFMRVQCRGDINILWRDRDVYQKRINQIDDIIANVYLTYDNSDLIIILKTATYRQGAAIVNTMRQGSNIIEESHSYCVLKNSFTVLAVRQSIIDAYEKLCVDDEIEQVDIRFIEKQGNGIAKIEEKLRAEIQNMPSVKCIRRQVLGADDEVITFYDIPWKKFLSFYRNYNGILNNANEEYTQFVLGTTAVIMEQADIIDGLLEMKESSEQLAVKQQKQEYEESEKYGIYIDKVADKLTQIKTFGDQGICKSLEVVVNALAKFKQPVFSDYLFVTIIRPLDCLLDLIISNEKEGKGARFGNRKAYLDFIISFNMYTQNSIRSDRHSMQVMDLNAKIYDIPVMLNAFYNAYISRVCDLLNKPIGKTEYNFFAMPGMNYKVNVIELYKRVNDKRRFIKVEIPEQKYYDMKGTMIVLTHEVAHYVGRDIRERKYRYNNYIQNIAHIYITYVVYMYNKYNQQHENQKRKIDFKTESLAKRMEVMLAGAMERETKDCYVKENKLDMDYLSQRVDSNIIEKIARGKKDYQTYMSFIKEYSGNAMLGVMLYCIEDVFAPVIYDMEKDETEDFLNLVHQITERFLSEYHENSTMISMKTATERLATMYEECFADLMSILLLQLTPSEYIGSFVDNALEQGISKEDIINYDHVFRALFVMICMVGQDDEYSWTIKEIGEVREQFCGKVVEEIALLYKLYYNTEQKTYDNVFYDKNCTNIFKDRKVIENISDYLIKCKDQFLKIKDKFYTKQDKLKLDTIRNLYKFSKESNNKQIEYQMIKQLEFIREYKQDLFDSWNAGENI